MIPSLSHRLSRQLWSSSLRSSAWQPPRLIRHRLVNTTPSRLLFEIKHTPTLRRYYAVQPSVHSKPSLKGCDPSSESEATTSETEETPHTPTSKSTSPKDPLVEGDSGEHAGPRKISDVEKANVETGHARFIAEADQHEDWKGGVGNAHRGGTEGSGKEVKDIKNGRGKLSPTSTHLFKLMLPLPALDTRSKAYDQRQKTPPTVFLLHPSQPLSHVSRLIQSSIPNQTSSQTDSSGSPLMLPGVSFRSANPGFTSSDSSASSEGPSSAATKDGDESVQWSDSTDIGDFVKEAARSTEFFVVLTPPPGAPAIKSPPNQQRDSHSSSSSSSSSSSRPSSSPEPYIIPVSVPTFEDRTHFLRKRLAAVENELKEMQGIKNLCDMEAHRGAKRVAVGGFAILVTYWVVVLRLTFFTSLGWDVMEPITYLTEFLFILGGYMWFLYQGREVSYSSILNRSVSTRRQNLYASRGLDIDKWGDLVTESKALKKEIERIREDYDAGWKEGRKEDKSADDAGNGKAQALGDQETGDGAGPLVGSDGSGVGKPPKEVLREDEVVEGRRREISEEQEKNN